MHWLNQTFRSAIREVLFLRGRQIPRIWANSSLCPARHVRHGTSMGRCLPKNNAGELVNAREFDPKLLLDRRHIDRVSG